MNMLSFPARKLLEMGGWEIVGQVPDNIPKFVFTACPHTSNWDGVLMVMAALALKMPIRFLVKDGIDFFPLGAITRYFGGIPVNRSSSNNVVEQMVDHFNKADHLMLGIAPEGTRSYKAKIRTGFYHIAVGAKVPIVCGFIDFKTRRIGIGDTIPLTGDIHVDMAKIRDFYYEMEGKHKELYNRELTF